MTRPFRTLPYLLASVAVVAACSGPAPMADIASSASDGRTEASMAPEPMMMAEPVLESAPSMGARSFAPSPRRGVVTAGDIDDTLNLAAFKAYLARTASDLGLPQASLGSPVMARLTGPDGTPAPGVRVTLRKPGAAEPFYDSYSGVDGMVTVFPGLYGAGTLSQVDLRAFPTATGAEVTQRIATGRRATVALPAATGWQPDFLDLVIVLDTTGSMGDELAWLTRELTGVVANARAKAPGVDIRYGLVVYRDQGDDYVVRNFGFTGDPATMNGWLRAQRADGGGDEPEAAAAALQSAVALDWRRGKGERLLVHVADAPPHDGDARAYLAAARQATVRGVQIFGLGASGASAPSEALMRQAAVMTGGRYLFLTDDSGVGLSHAEPTIACYRVTQLNDLLARVLASELTGRRIEAGAGQVLREVGTYANGVCRN